MKDISAVILCAGRGTRMNDDSKNKVSFDCAGVPVIKRIISNMKSAGIKRFVVVVGYLAETVMSVLSDESGVVFAYQKEQLGTGHAAAIGLKTLKDMGIGGSVIISMGDKIIDSSVIEEMIAKSEGADVVWGVQPLWMNKNGGRIVTVDDKPYGIVEFADAAFYNLYGVAPEKRREKLESIGLNEKKIAKVLLHARESEIPEKVILGGREFQPGEVLNTEYANAAFYCFDLEKLAAALNGINKTNAQGERYLTDVMEYFSEREKIELLVVNDNDKILTYSTKPELRKISDKFLRHAGDYIFDIKNGLYDAKFKEIYGEDYEVQTKRYFEALNCFINKFGDKPVIITRAPGRINLMGRHIDHRGGSVNMLTAACDTIIIASRRDDDTVKMDSVNDLYNHTEFSISEFLNLNNADNWIDFIDSAEVAEYLEKTKGSWSNYIKAAVLRLAYTGEDLYGIDCMISGNIPTESGLSSSSSVVVACAEAMVALNSLNISDKELIELCGEGEWFVGSRGGAGDHAAMICAKSGNIAHLSFKPFTIEGLYPFSDNYSVLIINSGIRANKSSNAKDRFNEKIAAYEISLMLIKKSFPDLDIEEFRDIAKLPDDKIYEILIDLPEVVDRKTIIHKLPERAEKLERIFATHKDPGRYNLRGVTLFGVSECQRAEYIVKFLIDKDYDAVGDIMKISHNGDRAPDRIITYEYLKDNSDRKTPVYTLPGSYGCSMPEIDEICDILNGAEGVAGSSIMGAGLGGSVVALCKSEYAADTLKLIKKEYFDKYNKEFSAFETKPSMGSLVLY